jgi:hypothetical protein
VDAIGAGGEGDVGAGVDEELCGVGGAGCGGGEGGFEISGEGYELGGGEVFFPELKKGDGGCGEVGGLGEERGAAGEEIDRGSEGGSGAGAVGDGVAEHAFVTQGPRSLAAPGSPGTWWPSGLVASWSDASSLIVHEIAGASGVFANTSGWLVPVGIGLGFTLWADSSREDDLNETRNERQATA